MATLDELIASLGTGNEDNQPGGSQEKFIMSLLGNAAQQKGYQSLQLPALTLLLGDQIRGFDTQRAKQAQLAQKLKAFQMQRLGIQAQHEDQKMAAEQEQQKQGGVLSNMLTAGVPGQAPAPLLPGQEGPSPAPGFQVPNVAANPGQLYGQGIKAGTQGITAVKDYLAAMEAKKATLHNVPRDTTVINEQGREVFKSEPAPAKPMDFGDERESVAKDMFFKRFDLLSQDEVKKVNAFITAKHAAEKAADRAAAQNIAISGRDEDPLGKPTLDRTTGEAVNITKGEWRGSPGKYMVLTANQEKLKAGLDTAKNHMVLTSQFVEALPKTGIRLTNALGAKISQLSNDPNAVTLFQQLHSMTSLAIGGALIGGAGGRPGVRLAEFMGPAGVTEGDTLATAVTKMNNWMQIVERNAQSSGLPTVAYKEARSQINRNVAKELLRESGGDIQKAKAVAKRYNLDL